MDRGHKYPQLAFRLWHFTQLLHSGPHRGNDAVPVVPAHARLPMILGQVIHFASYSPSQIHHEGEKHFRFIPISAGDAAHTVEYIFFVFPRDRLLEPTTGDDDFSPRLRKQVRK